MKDQDNIFLSKFFIVFGALVVLTIIVVFSARIISSLSENSTEVLDTDEFAKLQLAKLNERIAPVGRVVTGKIDVDATTTTTKQTAVNNTGKGEDVYNAACVTCHETGLMDAPKLGDKAAWETRLAQGLDAVLKNATNGKGSMPPRGGSAELSDADLKSVVIYMLQQSGQKVAASDAGQDQQGELAVAIVTPVEKESAAAGLANGEEIYNSACVTCHGTGLMDAPKLGDKANWGSRFAEGLDAVLKNAANGKGSMPPRGGNAELSDADLESVVVYMLQQSGQTVAGIDSSDVKESAKIVEAQDSTVEAEEKVTEDPVSVIPEKPVEPPAQMEVALRQAPQPVVAPVVIDHSNGEKIYKKACSSCHDAGVDNAPRMDDVMTWVGLMAAGNEQLYASTVDGKGAMPPKGGHKNLSESDIKEAVDFIISKVISAL